MESTKGYRKKFAQHVTDIAGIKPINEKLIAAFELVRRENYLGPGPWEIRTNEGYTATDDVSLLYQDVLVALDSKEKINNGQPSLHASCLDAIQIEAGDTILHIGAGTGYYTAILAELTGLSGSVFAYEINTELSERALDNLKHRSNIYVQDCSGTVGTLPECNVIYVSAGVTGPPVEWFNALKPKGRIIFPLTSTLGSGGMLLLERVDETRYLAEFTGAASFIPCIGARDERSAFKLADKFNDRSAKDVKSLHRGSSPDETCWFSSEDWWLSTRPIK
jgi:protein-L-isoaspartate(D-aspartate) O-methyltransferase